MSTDGRSTRATSTTRPSRRRFIEMISTAGASALVGAGLSIGSGRAASGSSGSAHAVDALLLTCMDYRLANEVAFFMNEHGMVNKYDHVILAGATLGVATDKFPAWAETFWQHLDIAIKLHKVRRVIAINHRDCGAFKVAFEKDYSVKPAEETEVHTKVMEDFRKLVKAKQPSLEVETFLMYLDGHVQAID